MSICVHLWLPLRVGLLLGTAALTLVACSKETSKEEPKPGADSSRVKASLPEPRRLQTSAPQDSVTLESASDMLRSYIRQDPSSPEVQAGKRQQVHWLIQNHPDSKIAGSPLTSIFRDLDREGYEEGKRLWLEQVARHDTNAMVMGNAAQFLLLHDPALAEQYLKKAQQLDPTNPEWSRQLGQLYSLQEEPDAPAKALAEYEKSYAATSAENERFYGLTQLAKAAQKAGEAQKATQYSGDLLQAAEKFPKDWNYGNALHHANIVLGQVALKEGDQKQAAEYLLKAGQTPGSPQLNSFGPNMTLANELLKKGERERVLEYFELCRKFWRMGEQNLNQWTREVNEGKTPSFGPNLRY